jgi:hypothetical protein
LRLAHCFRVLVLFAASPVFAPAPAQAIELGAGFAAVEEGDDRIRPAAALHLGLNNDWAGNAYYYGREFGPVKEETFLLNFVKNWSIFKSKFLAAHFGPCAMNEKTTLTFDDEFKDENRSENNFNAGAVYGISWSLPKSQGPLFLSVSWDSHIFAAGLNGGLLLSSGRKQTIALVGGMTL